MRLLDLFCGAGMASDGYRMAGFTDILGIDINPQPDYPYEFVQGDALQMLQNGTLPEFEFDALHASPPCQLHTRAKHLREAQGGKSKYVDLLSPTLEALRNSPFAYHRWPWVVENVPGAPGLEEAAVCCGSSFGLGVRRHRLFLSNYHLNSTVCRHKEQGRPYGVYHTMNDNIPKGGRTARSVEHGLEVMGVDRHIPWNSLKEGFPPHYTQHIGQQIMEVVTDGEFNGPRGIDDDIGGLARGVQISLFGGVQ